MTERMQNNVKATIGQAKQTVGQTLAYPGLAAEGAAQKTEAESAQRMADAKVHREGVGHTIEGEVQKRVGAMTSNPAMEARGHANVAKGEIQRNV